MLDAFDHLTDARRCVAPDAQGRDHVGSHFFAESETPDGATRRSCAFDIGVIGSGDVGENRVVLESASEPLVEVGHAIVGNTTQGRERSMRARHGPIDRLGHTFGDSHERSVVMHDDETITGHEVTSEVLVDRDPA